VRFGLSSHLFHDQPLAPQHLAAVARHGFSCLELFATRTHFDYHDEARIRDLAGWLRDTGLELHSVHAPIVEGYVGGVWGAVLSNAASDAGARARTIRETEAALEVAQIVPYRFLVVHLGVTTNGQETGDNSRDAARRSIEQLHELATRRGVRLALEVIPNALSTVDALVELVEDDLELPDVGICLDYGHAFLMGDVADAIEAASGHLLTTHLHDNLGKTDDHLVPFDGRIDWSTAVMTTQKVGYEGVWMMELANTGDAAVVLQKAHDAAARMRDLALMND
jgi:sugar phosphate isomerase/epimerase